MTTFDIEEYLSRPLLANLATVRPDGSPHVAPVWFQYRDGQVRMVVDTSAVKVRNIQHDPRVSLSVATQERPYLYVMIRGTAQLSKEGVPEMTRVLAVRYQGEEEGNRYADRLLKEADSFVITVRPDKIVSWTAAD